MCLNGVNFEAPWAPENVLLFLDDVVVSSHLMGTLVALTTLTTTLKFEISSILHEARDEVMRRTGLRGRLEPNISKNADINEAKVGNSSPIRIFVFILSRLRFSQWFVIIS